MIRGDLEKCFGSIDMKSTFDTMGPVQTHDGNGTIDYIFHTNTLKTLSQSAKPTDASDHRILYVKLQGQASSSPSVNNHIKLKLRL